MSKIFYVVAPDGAQSNMDLHYLNAQPRDMDQSPRKDALQEAFRLAEFNRWTGFQILSVCLAKDGSLLRSVKLGRYAAQRRTSKNRPALL